MGPQGRYPPEPELYTVPHHASLLSSAPRSLASQAWARPRTTTILEKTKHFLHTTSPNGRERTGFPNGGAKDELYSRYVFLLVRCEVATRHPHETTSNLVLQKKTQRSLRASGYTANLREPASEGQIPSSDQHTISVSFEHTFDDEGEPFFIKAGMKMSERRPHWALSTSLEVCFRQVDSGILPLVRSQSR